MSSFDSGLIPVAILEGVVGILKSRSTNNGVFWLAFLTETWCAMIQSAALLMKAKQEGYSGLEKLAAYLTVCSDAMLLIVEAILVAKVLGAIKRDSNFDKKQFYAVTTYITSVTTITLGLSGLPILLPKFQRESPEKPFKSLAPQILMVSLAVLPGRCFVYHSPANVVWYYWRLSWISEIIPILPVVVVCIVLGVIILTSGENLSPAIITSLPFGIYWSL